MEKFSIYEVLSFFFPGVLLVALVAQFITAQWLMFTETTVLVQNIICTIIALVSGLAIHRVTFWLIEYNWFKAICMKRIETIAKQNEYEVNYPLQQIKKIDGFENISTDEIFNKAYHYLQQNGKLDSALSFQSMYFFLRNIITICLLALPVCILLLVFDIAVVNGFKTLVLLLLLLTLSLTANFYRMKMVSRVLAGYYSALQNKTTK